MPNGSAAHRFPHRRRSIEDLKPAFQLIFWQHLAQSIEKLFVAGIGSIWRNSGMMRQKASDTGLTSIYLENVQYRSKATIILETAVEARVQAQGTELKGFSTAPQFTKTVNSSMTSNG